MLDMNWRLLYSPSSPKFLLPFLLCLIFNIIPPCSSSSNISTCSSLRFSCGNITGVDYPFWGESRPRRCGYPPLKLSCDPKNNQTTIRIADVTHHVLELNQTSRILKIARYDFSEGICSPGRGNTELDHQGAFEYAPGSVTVSFFYNCTKSSSPFLEGYFSCPRGSVYKDGFALVGPETEIGMCSSSVTVGIQVIYYGFRNNLAKMEEALREGFQVKYTGCYCPNTCAEGDDDECSDKVNGVCSYGIDAEKLCYCPNNLTYHSCGSATTTVNTESEPPEPPTPMPLSRGSTTTTVNTESEPTEPPTPMPLSRNGFVWI